MTPTKDTTCLARKKASRDKPQRMVSFDSICSIVFALIIAIAAVNSEKPLEKDLSQELKVEGGKSTEEDDYVEVDLDEGDYEKVGMDDAEIEEWEVI